MSGAVVVDCRKFTGQPVPQPAAPMSRIVITARGVPIPAHAKPTKKNGK